MTHEHALKSLCDKTAEYIDIDDICQYVECVLCGAAKDMMYVEMWENGEVLNGGETESMCKKCVLKNEAETRQRLTESCCTLICQGSGCNRIFYRQNIGELLEDYRLLCYNCIKNEEKSLASSMRLFLRNFRKEKIE